MSLTILNNSVGLTDFIAIDSHFVILVQVDHGGNPNDLAFEIRDLDDNTNYVNGICVPYKDISYLSRIFWVDCSLFAKSLFDIDSLNDEAQITGSLQEIDKINKRMIIYFTYTFEYGETDTITYSFVATRGVRQFGETSSIDNVNDIKVYTSVAGGECYLYIYNDDENNIITVDGINFDTNYATDLDGSIYTDYNGDRYTILTI